MVRETRHLWVGNLPDNIREDRIREHFKRYGRVQSVRILSPRKGDGAAATGICATVSFMDIKSASKAHNHEHTLDDLALTTEYYEPASIPLPPGSPAPQPPGEPPPPPPMPSPLRPPSYASPRFHGASEEISTNFDRSSHFFERRDGVENCFIRRPPSSGFHVSPSESLRGRTRERDRLYRNGPHYSSVIERAPPPHHRTVTTSSWPTYENSTCSRFPQSVVTKPEERRSHKETRRKPGSPVIVVHKKDSQSRRECTVMQRGESHESESVESSPTRSHISDSSAHSRSSSPDSASSISAVSERSFSSHKSAVTINSTGSNDNSDRSYFENCLHEERSPSSVCIKNFPDRLSGKKIREFLMHEFGRMCSLKSVRIYHDEKERRFGVMSFKTALDAEKALKFVRSRLIFDTKLDAIVYHSCDIDDDTFKRDENGLNEYHRCASRTLFIGNIDDNYNKTDLRKIFQRYGKVLDVEVNKIQHSTYALCEFPDVYCVVRTIRSMNNEYIGKKRVCLGFGKSIPSKCLWMGGITDDITKKRLTSTFNQIGEVSHVVINRSNETALVFYKKIRDTISALSQMRGCAIVKDKRLIIDYASDACQHIFHLELEKSTLQHYQNSELHSPQIAEPTHVLDTPESSSSSNGGNGLIEEKLRASSVGLHTAAALKCSRAASPIVNNTPSPSPTASSRSTPRPQDTSHFNYGLECSDKSGNLIAKHTDERRRSRPSPGRRESRPGTPLYDEEPAHTPLSLPLPAFARCDPSPRIRSHSPFTSVKAFLASVEKRNPLETSWTEVVQQIEDRLEKSTIPRSIPSNDVEAKFLAKRKKREVNAIGKKSSLINQSIVSRKSLFDYDYERVHWAERTGNARPIVNLPLELKLRAKPFVAVKEFYTPPEKISIPKPDFIQLQNTTKEFVSTSYAKLTESLPAKYNAYRISPLNSRRSSVDCERISSVDELQRLVNNDKTRFMAPARMDEVDKWNADCLRETSAFCKVNSIPNKVEDRLLNHVPNGEISQISKINPVIEIAPAQPSEKEQKPAVPVLETVTDTKLEPEESLNFTERVATPVVNDDLNVKHKAIETIFHKDRKKSVASDVERKESQSDEQKQRKESVTREFNLFEEADKKKSDHKEEVNNLFKNDDKQELIKSESKTDADNCRKLSENSVSNRKKSVDRNHTTNDKKEPKKQDKYVCRDEEKIRKDFELTEKNVQKLNERNSESSKFGKERKYSSCSSIFSEHRGKLSSEFESNSEPRNKTMAMKNNGELSDSKSAKNKRKKSRVKKAMNDSSTESEQENSGLNRQKKRSTSNIQVEEPVYTSMYDKVKARSTKNLQKQEEEKRQEKLKEKFSQLKQSRVKREEKKRSTSYDEDTTTDQERGARRFSNKLNVDSTEDESEVDKIKVSDSSDFDQRKTVSKPVEEKKPRRRKTAVIARDTSDEDMNKKKTKFNNICKTKSGISDISDDELKPKIIPRVSALARKKESRDSDSDMSLHDEPLLNKVVDCPGKSLKKVENKLIPLEKGILEVSNDLPAIRQYNKDIKCEPDIGCKSTNEPYNSEFKENYKEIFVNTLDFPPENIDVKPNDNGDDLYDNTNKSESLSPPPLIDPMTYDYADFSKKKSHHKKKQKHQKSRERYEKRKYSRKEHRKSSHHDSGDFPKSHKSKKKNKNKTKPIDSLEEDIFGSMSDDSIQILSVNTNPIPDVYDADSDSSIKDITDHLVDELSQENCVKHEHKKKKKKKKSKNDKSKVHHAKMETELEKSVSPPPLLLACTELAIIPSESSDKTSDESASVTEPELLESVLAEPSVDMVVEKTENPVPLVVEKSENTVSILEKTENNAEINCGSKIIVENIHEKAVQSIENITDTTIKRGPEQRVALNTSLEEKPITQEETEDAVAAILGDASVLGDPAEFGLNELGDTLPVETDTNASKEENTDVNEPNSLVIENDDNKMECEQPLIDEAMDKFRPVITHEDAIELKIIEPTSAIAKNECSSGDAGVRISLTPEPICSLSVVSDPIEKDNIFKDKLPVECVKENPIPVCEIETSIEKMFHDTATKCASETKPIPFVDTKEMSESVPQKDVEMPASLPIEETTTVAEEIEISENIVQNMVETSETVEEIKKPSAEILEEAEESLETKDKSTDVLIQETDKVPEIQTQETSPQATCITELKKSVESENDNSSVPVINMDTPSVINTDVPISQPDVTDISPLVEVLAEKEKTEDFTKVEEKCVKVMEEKNLTTGKNTEEDTTSGKTELPVMVSVPEADTFEIIDSDDEVEPPPVKEDVSAKTATFHKNDDAPDSETQEQSSYNSSNGPMALTPIDRKFRKIIDPDAIVDLDDVPSDTEESAHDEDRDSKNVEKVVNAFEALMPDVFSQIPVTELHKIANRSDLKKKLSCFNHYSKTDLMKLMSTAFPNLSNDSYLRKLHKQAQNFSSTIDLTSDEGDDKDSDDVIFVADSTENDNKTNDPTVSDATANIISRRRRSAENRVENNNQKDCDSKTRLAVNDENILDTIDLIDESDIQEPSIDCNPPSVKKSIEHEVEGVKENVDNLESLTTLSDHTHNSAVNEQNDELVEKCEVSEQPIEPANPVSKSETAPVPVIEDNQISSNIEGNLVEIKNLSAPLIDNSSVSEIKEAPVSVTEEAKSILEAETVRSSVIECCKSVVTLENSPVSVIKGPAEIADAPVSESVVDSIPDIEPAKAEESQESVITDNLFVPNQSVEELKSCLSEPVADHTNEKSTIDCQSNDLAVDHPIDAHEIHPSSVESAGHDTVIDHPTDEIDASNYEFVLIENKGSESLTNCTENHSDLDLASKFDDISSSETETFIPDPKIDEVENIPKIAELTSAAVKETDFLICEKEATNIVNSSSQNMNDTNSVDNSVAAEPTSEGTVISELNTRNDDVDQFLEASFTQKKDVEEHLAEQHESVKPLVEKTECVKNVEIVDEPKNVDHELNEKDLTADIADTVTNPAVVHPASDELEEKISPKIDDSQSTELEPDSKDTDCSSQEITAKLNGTEKTPPGKRGRRRKIPVPNGVTTRRGKRRVSSTFCVTTDVYEFKEESEEDVKRPRLILTIKGAQEAAEGWPDQPCNGRKPKNTRKSKRLQEKFNGDRSSIDDVIDAVINATKRGRRKKTAADTTPAVEPTVVEQPADEATKTPVKRKGGRPAKIREVPAPAEPPETDDCPSSPSVSSSSAASPPPVPSPAVFDVAETLIDPVTGLLVPMMEHGGQYVPAQSDSETTELPPEKKAKMDEDGNPPNATSVIMSSEMMDTTPLSSKYARTSLKKRIAIKCMNEDKQLLTVPSTTDSITTVTPTMSRAFVKGLIEESGATIKSRILKAYNAQLVDEESLMCAHSGSSPRSPHNCSPKSNEEGSHSIPIEPLEIDPDTRCLVAPVNLSTSDSIDPLQQQPQPVAYTPTTPLVPRLLPPSSMSTPHFVTKTSPLPGYVYHQPYIEPVVSPFSHIHPPASSPIMRTTPLLTERGASVSPHERICDSPLITNPYTAPMPAALYYDVLPPNFLPVHMTPMGADVAPHAYAPLYASQPTAACYRVEQATTPRIERSLTPRVEQASTSRTERALTPRVEQTSAPRVERSSTPRVEQASTSRDVLTPRARELLQTKMSSPIVGDLPPQDDVNNFLQDKNVAWEGLLTLKSFQIPIQMYYASGESKIVANALYEFRNLRIAQRMRLEPSQLEGVAKKMESQTDYCVLYVIACGGSDSDINRNNQVMVDEIIPYLLSKKAAGIINTPHPGTQQAAFVVHIFPPCDFERKALRKAVPKIHHMLEGTQHLLCVIATA